MKTIKDILLTICLFLILFGILALTGEKHTGMIIGFVCVTVGSIPLLIYQHIKEQYSLEWWLDEQEED